MEAHFCHRKEKKKVIDTSSHNLKFVSCNSEEKMYIKYKIRIVIVKYSDFFFSQLQEKVQIVQLKSLNSPF